MKIINESEEVQNFAPKIENLRGLQAWREVLEGYKYLSKYAMFYLGLESPTHNICALKKVLVKILECEG